AQPRTMSASGNARSRSDGSAGLEKCTEGNRFRNASMCEAGRFQMLFSTRMYSRTWNVEVADMAAHRAIPERGGHTPAAAGGRPGAPPAACALPAETARLPPRSVAERTPMETFRSMRFRALFALPLALAVLAPAHALAGPWNLAPGEYYAQIQSARSF